MPADVSNPIPTFVLLEALEHKDIFQ